MQNKTIIFIVLLNLSALLLLTIFAPQLMISPGTTMDAHVDFSNNCFACHSPFVGSTAEKCINCHKVPTIGIKTSKGLLVDKEKKNVAFHQKLLEDDCVACHSDHKGVQAFNPIGQFSHALLDTDTRKQCGSCHLNPSDALHQKIKGNCGQCHTQDRWKPATFDHDKYFGLYATNSQTQCDSCHVSPTDALHKKLKSNCKQCHTIDRWKPATFNHDKYFRFDRKHTTECETCHINHDYSQYSCYGCHEHSRSNIRAEHVEEGIHEYEQCVKCHRSADEDEAKRKWRSKNFESGQSKPFKTDSHKDAKYGDHGKHGDRDHHDDD